LQSGKDVPRGEAGEVWLSGANVMLGYLNRPEADAECLIPCEEVKGKIWFRTGDIGHCKDDMFYITDRLKELIKVKGMQVVRLSSLLSSVLTLLFLFAIPLLILPLDFFLPLSLSPFAPC
jgi:long-subunit acyl-CoA synthetase (AMP-forming)